MKIKIAVLSLIVVGLAFACAGSAARSRTGGEPGDRIQAEVGEEFTLEPSQLATLDQSAFAVRFLGVPHDSRCPTDVECIAAGNAVVRLRLSDAYGGRVTAELHTTVGAKSASHAGYTVHLVGLRPERTSGIRVQPALYRAVLRVAKD